MNPSRWLPILLLAACHRAAPADDPAGAPSVRVEPARLDSISEVLLLTGRLLPLPGGSVSLAAPTDAVVRSIEVQLGSAVRAGQLLLELDAPELATSASSMIARARSDSLDLARQRLLYEQGISSRRQLEEREATAAASRADAAAATQLLARARVTSPIAGGVQRLLVQVGERVSAGQPLVEVVNGSGVDLHAGVPAAALARIRIGQHALLQADGLDSPVTGTLIAMTPAVDSTTGMAEVVIRAGAARGLRAGGGATARLQLRLLRDVIVVPDSAVVPADTGVQLFVVGPDSIARGRAVTVQVRSSGRVAVAGEVKRGERVITSGAYGLTDSSRVTPVASE